MCAIISAMTYKLELPPLPKWNKSDCELAKLNVLYALVDTAYIYLNSSLDREYDDNYDDETNSKIIGCTMTLDSCLETMKVLVEVLKLNQHLISYHMKDVKVNFIVGEQND